MSLETQLDINACDLLEQAMMELNELQRETDFPAQNEEIEIIIPPPRNKKTSTTQTENVTPPPITRKDTSIKKKDGKNSSRDKKNPRCSLPPSSLKTNYQGVFRKESDTTIKKKPKKNSYKEDIDSISDRIYEVQPRTFNPFMGIADLDQDGTISDWSNTNTVIKIQSLKSVKIDAGEIIEVLGNIILFDNPKWIQCFLEKNLCMMYSITNELNIPHVSVIFRHGTYGSLNKGRQVKVQVVNNSRFPFFVKMGDVIAHIQFFVIPISPECA